MAIAAFLVVCAMATWCWVTAVPAIWTGEIQTVRLIGRGSATHDRSERPIRYGCALLLHLYFGVTFTVMAIAMLSLVPAEQWILGAAFGTGIASLALSWRLGRPNLGSSAQLVRAALNALEQAPRPAPGYRASSNIPPSALSSALAPVVRAELLKCDVACALALAAISLAVIGAMLESSASGWGGGVLSAFVGGFGVFRWRALRRAIVRAADEAALSVAQRG